MARTFCHTHPVQTDTSALSNKLNAEGPHAVQTYIQNTTPTSFVCPEHGDLDVVSVEMEEALGGFVYKTTAKCRTSNTTFGWGLHIVTPGVSAGVR